MRVREREREKNLVINTFDTFISCVKGEWQRKEGKRVAGGGRVE
jgi:hypothetical protein